MSRSNYTDGLDDNILNLYRASVDRALNGKRGQAFLRELAAAMDAMPEKILISGELIDEDGDCCAIGAVCLARGMDASAIASIDYDDPDCVAKAVGIARSMAAEIEYLNDEYFCPPQEPPEHRWQRMRNWVDSKITATN